MNDPQAIWAEIWPYMGAVVAGASLIDATLPQPQAGSHWLVPRKIVSLLAINLANAANGAQPKFSTWLLVVVRGVLSANNLEAVAKPPPPPL